MSLFIFVNWLLVIITSVILLLMIRADRSLLIKPSITTIIFFHVMCQWGTAIKADEIESYLANPWVFVLLSHGFPLIGLVGSLITWRRSARALWKRIINYKLIISSKNDRAIFLLSSFFILLMLFYVNNLSLRTTGLYAILFSPDESTMARELSLKLLDSQFVKYCHAIMTAVLAPLLGVLLAQSLYVHVQRRNWMRILFYLGFLGLILMAVSISGARAFSAYILLTIFYAAMLARGFLFKPVNIVLAILLTLTFPTLLTLMREGEPVNIEYFFNYLLNLMIDRIVILPMETGLWYVQYVQENGFFGIAAIPKLANLMEIESIDVSNFISSVHPESPVFKEDCC